MTALRLWKENFDEVTRPQPGTPEAEAVAARTIDRLVARQLAYLEAAAKRRVEYLREATTAAGGDPSTVVDPLGSPRSTTSTGIVGSLRSR